MNKEKRHEYKLATYAGIIGATAAVIIPSILDFLQKKPVYTSVWYGLKWFWFNIVMLRIPLWVIVLGVLAVIWISRYLKKKNDQKKSKNPEFTKYTNDTIEGIDWQWKWEYNGKWSVANLIPICPNCNSMSFYHNETGYDYSYLECPKCDHIEKPIRRKDKVRAIIINNANQIN